MIVTLFIVESSDTDGQFAFSGVLSQNLFCHYQYCIVLFCFCDEINVLSLSLCTVLISHTHARKTFHLTFNNRKINKTNLENIPSRSAQQSINGKKQFATINSTSTTYHGFFSENIQKFTYFQNFTEISWPSSNVISM